MVKGKWARGHVMRGEGGYDGARLPDGDVSDEELDDIIAMPAAPPPLRSVPRGGAVTDDGSDDDLPDWLNPPDQPGGADDEIPPDPEPAHLKAVPGGKGKPGTKGKPQRVTAAVRQDIGAKVALLVTLPGHVWEARDPVCGGAWLAQSSAISKSLTEIVLDSPDLIAWFTGPAGGFMKYLNLIMAVQPVAMTVFAHHITHAISTDQAQPAPDEAARAAAQAYAA